MLKNTFVIEKITLRNQNFNIMRENKEFYSKSNEQRSIFQFSE